MRRMPAIRMAITASFVIMMMLIPTSTVEERQISFRPDSGSTPAPEEGLRASGPRVSVPLGCTSSPCSNGAPVTWYMSTPWGGNQSFSLPSRTDGEYFGGSPGENCPGNITRHPPNVLGSSANVCYVGTQTFPIYFATSPSSGNLVASTYQVNLGSDDGASIYLDHVSNFGPGALETNTSYDMVVGSPPGCGYGCPSSWNSNNGNAVPGAGLYFMHVAYEECCGPPYGFSYWFYTSQSDPMGSGLLQPGGAGPGSTQTYIPQAAIYGNVNCACNGSLQPFPQVPVSVHANYGTRWTYPLHSSLDGSWGLDVPDSEFPVGDSANNYTVSVDPPPGYMVTGSSVNGNPQAFPVSVAVGQGYEAMINFTLAPLGSNVLGAVSIIPSFAQVSPGGNATFSASPVCSGGPCPSGTRFAWSLTNSSLGTLTTAVGPSVAFVAGGNPGNETLRVNATLNGITQVSPPARIEITPSPGGLRVTTFKASPASLTVGSWTNLSATVVGQKGSVYFSYLGLPDGCLSQNVSTLPCRPLGPGNRSVTVSVTDTAGDRAAASTLLNVTGRTSLPHTLLHDAFKTDHPYPGNEWSYSGGVLRNISREEGAEFGVGTQLLYYPGEASYTAPSGWLPANYGLVLDSGNALTPTELMGISTDQQFVAPFTVYVNASIDFKDAAGGSPLALWISNPTDTSIVSVYGGLSPSDLPDIFDRIGNVSAVQSLAANVGGYQHMGFEIQVGGDYSATVSLWDNGAVLASSQGTMGTGPQVYQLTIGMDRNYPAPPSNLVGVEMGSNVSTVDVTSYQTWSVVSNVTAYMPTPSGTRVEYPSNLEVSYHDVWSNETYYALTDSNGRAVASGLPSGVYQVRTGLSDSSPPGVVYGSAEVFLGNPENPSAPTRWAPLAVLVPPPPSFSIGILSSNGTKGLNPFETALELNISGGLGNYVVNWYGVQSPSYVDPSSPCDLACNVTLITGDYAVSATVTTSGRWFGFSIGPETAVSAALDFSIVNAVWYVQINPESPVIDVTLSSHGWLFMNTAGTSVSLAVPDVSDTQSSFFPLPTNPINLANFLGLSDAWSGLSLGNGSSVPVIHTDIVAQPGEDLGLLGWTNLTLPYTALQLDQKEWNGSSFQITLDSTAWMAIALDILDVGFALVGFIQGLTAALQDEAKDVISDLAKGVVESVAETMATCGISSANDAISQGTTTTTQFGDESACMFPLLVSNLGGMVSLIESYLSAPSRFSALLTTTVVNTIVAALGAAILTLVGELSSVVGALIPLAQFLLDLTAVLAAVYSPQPTTDYMLNHAKRELTVGDGSANIETTLQTGGQTYGYDGSWKSTDTGGGFIHSAWTPTAYDFAVVPNGTTTLTVGSTQGHAGSPFDLTLFYEGDKPAYLNGTTPANGGSLTYALSLQNGAIHIAPETTPNTHHGSGSGSGSVGSYWPVFVGIGAGALVLALWVLRRRRLGGGSQGPSSSGTEKQEESKPQDEKPKPSEPETGPSAGSKEAGAPTEDSST